MISDRRFFFRSLLLIFFVSFSFIKCSHEPDLSEFPEVCFTRDVLPVFLNNCTMTGCHDGTGESDMSFRNYNEIVDGITPGNADKSEIYKSLIDKWGERMPPDKPLSVENRTKIRLWIEQGAIETTCADQTGNNGGNDSLNTPGVYVARACFSRDILPVIVSHCATTDCHDAVSHKEGYNFTDYTRIRNAVTAGNPGASKLFRSIISSEADDKMPPAGSPQLALAQIDSIRNWITYGALNEQCGEVCDTLNPVTFSGSIWPLIQSTCTGCHSGNAPSGNVTLTSYTNVAAVASSGLLMKSLKGEGVTRMPPAGSLSVCRIRQVDLWIKNGYQNN